MTTNTNTNAPAAQWMNVGTELPNGYRTVTRDGGWTILGFTCKPEKGATRQVARRLLVADGLFAGAPMAIVEAAMEQLVVDASNNGGRRAVKAAAALESFVPRDVIVRTIEELTALRTRANSQDDVVKLVAQLRKAGASNTTIAAAIAALEA